MKRLGFDIDGVLYPWHQHIYDYLWMEGKVDVTYTYFWMNYLSFQHLIKPLLEDKYFYQVGEPYKGAVETVWRYAKDYSIAYITQRPKITEVITRRWLSLWEFPNTSSTLVLNDKAEYIAYHNFDYYVEDRAEYIHKIYDYTQVIGVRQPWNEDYFLDSLTKKILWINDISELPKVLEI
jgi:FMN phosphatase YigB (HAD superfamily)